MHGEYDTLSFTPGNSHPEMYYPRREWQHVMTYDIQAESVDPFWMALVHYRPAYTCKQQYNPPDPNEMRWECAEHVGCDRKIRILKDGAQMKISISGDHSGQPRDLKRVRFPPHIEQFILDAATRGENASHILAHALEEYPEFAERLTKTRSVKENNPLPSKLIHLETNFNSQDFVCALTSTDMLVSLKWFLDSCPKGFPLYMDTQQKIIRGKPKVVWMGSSRIRYDARRKKYVHSFVPFIWAIVPEESAGVYDFMLGKLNELMITLSGNRSSLADVVNLCVHDAHQGAISACKGRLPDVRNARCFYHFKKNLTDNKKKLGAAFELVEKCIFPLHISTNDSMFNLLAEALIDQTRDVSGDAAQYLTNTLDTDRYGFPNIAITAQGLEGTQVVNNIVEALNSIMSKALDGESFDIGIFVREAILIMRSIKKSSPQCFINRPTPVIMKEYHPEMRQNGTNMFNNNDFKELEDDYTALRNPMHFQVTEIVSSLMDVAEDTRFLPLRSAEISGSKNRDIPKGCGTAVSHGSSARRFRARFRWGTGE
ncbi:hypothetical protein FOZ60_016427 [Perkinsus olseni]|uniref:MULE transposase domain-containing protein n=1 Tax=Perkinsus olseni TaxID=32597 RepID=A0A7J6N3N6_PEROL|nr:hypothetical protein FOZ60_016427 [Perkinsus olseni]